MATPEKPPEPPTAPAMPPSAPAMPAMSGYAQGQVSFTQGGKKATWVLSKADFAEMGGMLAVTLDFSPDGKKPVGDGPALTLDSAQVGRGRGPEQADG